MTNERYSHFTLTLPAWCPIGVSSGVTNTKRKGKAWEGAYAVYTPDQLGFPLGMRVVGVNLA